MRSYKKICLKEITHFKRLGKCMMFFKYTNSVSTFFSRLGTKKSFFFMSSGGMFLFLSFSSRITFCCSAAFVLPISATYKYTNWLRPRNLLYRGKSLAAFSISNLPKKNSTKLLSAIIYLIAIFSTQFLIRSIMLT